MKRIKLSQIISKLKEKGLHKSAENLKRVIASEKKFWDKQYKGDLPHWMDDEEPSKLAKRFVEELKTIYDKDKSITVLEIGVGNGRDSHYFIEKGLRSYGIDISEKPVKATQKKVGKKFKDHFFQMDAEHLKFEDNEFKGIYSLSVLHSTDVSKSFKEVSRVLVDGGLFLCFMYLETRQTDGKIIDSHESLSKISTALEDNSFKLLDLYVNMENDEVDDEHNVPHIHSVLVIVAKKKK